LLLQIVEFLFSVVQSLLLVGNLLFVLRVLLVPVAGVAKAVAGVGVHGRGADLILTLQHVEFALGQIDRVLLGF